MTGRRYGQVACFQGGGGFARIVFLICASGTLVAGNAVSAEWKPWSGAATPPLKLRDLQGDWRTLTEFKGRVVVVNFWATWCEPCLEEMPSLQKLAERHADKPFAVIGVNLGEGEARIRGFVERTGTTFPLLLDRDGDVKRAWRVNGVPTTFVVDAAGRIRYSLVGGADFSEPGVESVIASLLAKNPGKSGVTRK